MAEKLFYRKSIVELLEDIAAEEPQTSETELVCGWFDDLYIPGFNRQDYTAEGWTRGTRDFENCFASHELEALARFHEFYDRWHQNGESDWAPVREHAAVTLRVFQ